MESDQEEDEWELEGEGAGDVEFYEERDRRTSEDLEEMSDPHSSKFRAEGQLMNYEEDPSFEGYLQVKASSSTCNQKEIPSNEKPIISDLWLGLGLGLV